MTNNIKQQKARQLNDKNLSVISCFKTILPATLVFYSISGVAQCNLVDSRFERNLSQDKNIEYLNKQVRSQSAHSYAASKQLTAKRKMHQPAMTMQGAVLMESDMAYVAPIPEISIQSLERENYQAIKHNRFVDVTTKPVSTFSTDVDTASYANVRRFINHGQLPPLDAVRTEEIINYFDYQYEKPVLNEPPVKISYELAASPWSSKSKLLKVAMQAKEAEMTNGSNIVFLIDVSGSMANANKLPLLKNSLKLFTDQLTANDCVSIVTYAGHANIVLNATSGDKKSEINRVIKHLHAGGSTNGGDGLALAYELAAANIRQNGVNRVLLATDGDFNVGMSDPSNMEAFISKKRKTGVDLSVLGFGQGNYNDHLMERLSNAGNGNAAYIDSMQEAHKVLVTQMRSNFVTVAYDTKVQIEFNPRKVASYRLLGYENRLLNKRDFNDDKKDAGDVGSAQSVTAIYEIFLKGDDPSGELRYQQPSTEGRDEKLKVQDKNRNELAFVKLRYKQKYNSPSKLLSTPVLSNKTKQLGQISNSFKLAISAAAYAEKLRKSSYLEDFSWGEIISLAKESAVNDPFGYRGQFVQQLRLTKAISQE